jgi:serine protease Do
MEEEKKPHFARPTMSRPPSLFNLVLLTVLVALAASFGGFWLARVFLPNSDGSYFNLVENIRDRKVIIEQPLISLATSHEKSVAGLYRPVSALPKVSQFLFSEDDFLGSAVVITSDGWLMTTDQVAVTNQSVVILGDNLYTIKEIKADNFSGAVFLKIEANFLTPIDFQLVDSLEAGERLFTNIDLPRSLEHAFYTNFLASPHYELSSYLFTEEVDYYLRLSGDFPSVNIKAAPYFNTDGDMVGLVYGQKEGEVLLVPAEYLKQAVKHLLNNSQRLNFGLRYIDMENNSGFVRRGNLIYHPTLKAIVSGSLAEKAGLKAGDQVVAINNEVISAERTLTSILQNYRQGDKLIVKILRNEIEQDIEWNL